MYFAENTEEINERNNIRSGMIFPGNIIAKECDKAFDFPRGNSVFVVWE